MSRRPLIVVLLVVAVTTLVIRSGRDTGSEGSGQARSGISDTVERVVDGDTVVLRSAGKSRLIGVDTPEVFGRPGCFGQEASDFAKRTLRPGSRVLVRRDTEPRDRYGRSLVYLTLADGRSFNELLVAEGFAVPLAIAPNTRHADRFRALAERARDSGAGLWAPTTCNGRIGDS